MFVFGLKIMRLPVYLMLILSWLEISADTLMITLMFNMFNNRGYRGLRGKRNSFVCMYTCTILNLKNVLHNEWLKLRPIVELNHFIRINIS